MTLLLPVGDERRYDNKKNSILHNNGVPWACSSASRASAS
jgi:hypothetical protein